MTSYTEDQQFCICCNSLCIRENVNCLCQCEEMSKRYSLDEIEVAIIQRKLVSITKMIDRIKSRLLENKKKENNLHYTSLIHQTQGEEELNKWVMENENKYNSNLTSKLKCYNSLNINTLELVYKSILTQSHTQSIEDDYNSQIQKMDDQSTTHNISNYKTKITLPGQLLKHNNIIYCNLLKKESDQQTIHAYKQHYISQCKNNGVSTNINGLVNIGATCYFNTAIKCLISNFPFVNQALSLSGASTLAHEFKLMVKQLLSHRVATVDPSKFKHELDKASNNQLAPNQQNDCYNGISIILEHLLKNKENPKTKLSEEVKPGETNQVFKIITDNVRCLLQSKSIVYEMFATMNLNTYTCTECKKARIIIDYHISFALESVNLKDIYHSLNKFYSDSTVDNKICQNCNKKRTFDIQKKPVHLPPIIVIKLMKASIGANNQYVSEKNLLKYPIDNEPLDLTYLVDKNIGVYYGIKAKPIYYLTSVAIQHGNLEGGHYLAYSYNHAKGQWYEHNDSFVKQIKNEQLLDKNALMLTYMRQDYFIYGDELEQYLSKS